MSKDAIIKELVEYVRKNTPTVKNVKEIPLDSRVFDLEILDSFAIVEMVAFVEHRYAIEITDVEIRNEFFKGLDAIAGVIGSKVSSRT